MSTVLLIDQTEPASPGSGKSRIWVPSDAPGQVRLKTSAGVVHEYAPAPVAGTHANRLAATAVKGKLWKESDTGLVYLGNGATWDVFNPIGLVRKSSDFTLPQSDVNLTSTDNDVPGMVFPVEANEIWEVECRFLLSAISTTPDIKVDFALPAGATYEGQRGADSAGSTAGTTPNVTSTSGGVALGLANGRVMARAYFYLTIGANAGNAQLRAAQNTSTAEDVKVLTNSLLVPRRIV